MPKSEVASTTEVNAEAPAIKNLEGLDIPEGDINRILEAMKQVVPPDWLVGRTWDGTRKEFAEILKTGRFPSRLRFFRLTIPDQKLFLQFLGTAVTMGMAAGSMVYYWAATTLGTEYLGAFGWAMVPLGGAVSWLITKIDGERREKQDHIVKAIRIDAEKAAELLALQREASKIFKSLFVAFEKAGYRRTDNILEILHEITRYYSPLSRLTGRDEVIAALEGGDFPPVLSREGDKFTVVYGSVPSSEPPTEANLIREIRQRIHDVLQVVGQPTADEKEYAKIENLLRSQGKLGTRSIRRR